MLLDLRVGSFSSRLTGWQLSVFERPCKDGYHDDGLLTTVILPQYSHRGSETLGGGCAVPADCKRSFRSLVSCC